MSTATSPERPTIGQWKQGYEIPVINERAVRAGAGLLFLGGAIAFGFALHTNSQGSLQPFGMIFMLDMLLRVLAGDRWSPSLALGRLIVSRQHPEWVGAPQKAFAWWLGFGLALVSCAGMGVLGAPLWVTFLLCGTCLSLLFLETAFGICVGCKLQSIFSTRQPLYCPGGVCAVHPSDHADAR